MIEIEKSKIFSDQELRIDRAPSGGQRPAFRSPKEGYEKDAGRSGVLIDNDPPSW